MPTLPLPHGRGMPARRSIALALALVATVALPVTPARAMTDTDAEGLLLGWINSARADRGLVPYARWTALSSLAGLRAGRLRDANTLSHSLPGDLGSQLTARGVTWYRYGETLAYASGGWNKDTVRRLYDSWRGSRAHWDLLMSDRMNYVGIGVAYRSSNGRIFGSVVMTDSPDHTGARAWMSTVSRSGDDVHWTWAGRDSRLQTRTAGLRDYDLQYRVDGGSWRLIRDNTTSTTITLRDRAHGHRYYLRVRATDRRGNVGAWSNPSTMWVP